MNKKFKISRKKLLTRLFSIVISLFLFTVFFMLGYILSLGGFLGSFTNHASDATKSLDIKNTQQFLSLDYCNIIADKSLPYNELKNFNLENDTIPFKNLGSFNSEGGMCLGISLIEKLNYMNKLIDIEFNYNETTFKFDEKINFQKLILNDKEINKLYPINGGTAITVPLVSEKLIDVDVDIKYSKNVNEEILEDFSKKLDDKFKINVINAINYLQKSPEKAFKPIEFMPHRYATEIQGSNLFVLRLLQNSKTEKKLDIDKIINKIDDDEPVILGVTYNKGGHALLGYKYEYVDKETLKVYVHDSNLPYIQKNNYDNKYDDKLIAKTNQDIKNNTFIIFKKEENEWHFIYNPKINNNYLYNGGWIDYIPGTRITMY